MGSSAWSCCSGGGVEGGEEFEGDGRETGMGNEVL